MWQQDTAPNAYTWQQALSYCETLTLGGYSDWRLPNRNELQSIVDYSRFNPAIDPIFNVVSFPNYWSSTTHAGIPHNSLSVYFYMGDFYSYPKSETFYVRAVRGGQCGAIICPAEKIYGEQSNETELLRYFRDNILEQTVEGRELIKLYYRWSPVIVKAMEEDVEFKQEIKELVDSILPMIEKSVRSQNQFYYDKKAGVRTAPAISFQLFRFANMPSKFRCIYIAGTSYIIKVST
jgi:hypothetical protein